MKKKIHPLHWTNVWLSLSKYSFSTRIRPKWVSQSPVSVELSACWAWRGDHIGTVTPSATVRIAKPAWALPKLPLNLCNPETQGEILTTSKQLLLQTCAILVRCRAFRPTGHERGPEHVHGVPVPASASLHSAWILVENRVSEMKIKWTSGNKPRRNEWILAPFQKAASRWESSTEEQEPLTAVWLCHFSLSSTFGNRPHFFGSQFS